MYGVGLLGITGERRALAASARTMARRLKAITDLPVLIGVGVSNAEQAAEVCQDADGAVLGAAVLRRLLDGGGVDEVGEFVRGLRSALDSL